MPARKSAKPQAPMKLPASFRRVAARYEDASGVTLEPGWGTDSAALKLKKKIFAMLVRGDLVVKLPKPRVDELVGENTGVRFDPRKNGQVMKEWLVVPETRSRLWAGLAEEAHAFAKDAAKK